jgi:YegS/Rv2252/BmrU family lipid kinase
MIKTLSIMKKITFVINGTLRNISSIKKRITESFEKDFDIDLKISSFRTDSMNIAEQGINEGSDYVIGVGGDGTMNEVVNGVMRIPKQKRENLIVGLFPTGSGNDFARTMKLSSHADKLKSYILNNLFTQIDIGKIECDKVNGGKTIRYFNNIADTGLGGEVTNKLANSRKLLGPTFTYFKSSIASFITYKKKRIKFTSPNFSWEGAILILCLANANYFGSGLGIAPHAKFDDGKIAVVIAGDVTLFDYLKNIPKIRKKEFLKHPGIIYNEVESCEIEPLDDNCLIETDGEVAGKLPLKLNVLKKELKVLSPINTINKNISL